MIDGDWSPEALVAQRLREVATRIGDSDDRETLNRIAGFLDNPKLPVRLAFKNRRSRPNEWQKRYAVARFVHSYRQKHDCTLTEAERAAEKHFPMMTERTARACWQDFGSLFRMTDENRALFLHFKDLEAKGFDVRVERVMAPLPKK